MPIDFTGEQFIPGQTSQRIADDHFARYNFALQYIKDKLVLDIACGSGYGSKVLREGGARSVDGVDISPDLIDYAKSHFQIAGINFYLDSLNTYTPKQDQLYDVITSFETIEHIENFRDGLTHLYSLLKQNGILLISTPNRPISSPNCKSINDKPSNPFHFREFTPTELIKELELSGFQVNANDLYGQRQQKYFKNKYLRRLYKLIFKPDIKNSPRISRLYAEPRYFLIVARKSK